MRYRLRSFCAVFYQVHGAWLHWILCCCASLPAIPDRGLCREVTPCMEFIPTPTIWNIWKVSFRSGKIWIAVANCTHGNLTPQKKIEYINCIYKNASIMQEVFFTNHTSAIRIKRVKELQPIDVRGTRQTSQDYFSRIFRLLAEQLLQPSFFSRLGSTRPDFQPSRIMMTGLAHLLQIELMDRAMSSRENASSLRRDAASSVDFFRNISLSQGIEEFALNSSLSILSNPNLWFVPSYPPLRY